MTFFESGGIISKSLIQSDISASGSVGGARPCQGRGRGFESRLALDSKKEISKWISLFLRSSPTGLEQVRGLGGMGMPPRSVLLLRRVIHWMTAPVSCSFYCISRAQEGSARARRLRSRHPCGCLGRFGGKKVHWTFFFFRLTPSRDYEIYILKIIPKS